MIQILDIDGEGTGVVELIAPALTSEPNNPAAKMYYLDPDTLMPLDGDTYMLDLSLHASKSGALTRGPGPRNHASGWGHQHARFQPALPVSYAL